MNRFSYFLYFLGKSLTLPVREYSLYDGDINTYSPQCLIAIVRVKLNGACKMALVTAYNYKN